MALAIGIVTVLSGAAQLALPGRALEALGIAAAPGSVLLMRLVSVLVLLIGAAQALAVWKASDAQLVLGLAGGAKLCAVALLLAAPLAITTTGHVEAGYDGLAGVFLLWMGVRGGRQGTEPQ